MSREPDYIRAYLTAGAIVCGLLDRQSPGLVVSVDIGGSLFDSIVRSRAELLGQDIIAFPTLLRYRSLLRGRRLPLQLREVVAEPVLLGRADALLRIVDECELIEGYGPQLVEVATRSIDAWCIGRPPVRLIHFGDTELMLDQIGGSERTMGRDRPIVTFYTAGLDKNVLHSMLLSRGYAAIDLGAKVVTTESLRKRSGFAWIGIPEERVNEVRAFVATDVLARESAISPWEREMLHSVSPRQRRSPNVFGLPAQPLPSARTISADDLVADDNFYPTEWDGDNCWRWTGPCPRTRLALPCPTPGPFHIELSVLSTHLPNGLNDCRVQVEGREVATTVDGFENGTIQFTGRIEEEAYTGFMNVDLVGRGLPRTAEGDPRTLRVSVRSATVSPCH